MKLDELTNGMTVRHPQHGEGTVQGVSNVDVSVLFGNVLRTVDADYLEVLSPDSAKQTGGQAPPLKEVIESTVEATLKRLGIDNPNAAVKELAVRWQKGKMVLHPADPNLQTKEVPLEVLFHKIVGIRNQLRVLEQKINANENLSDADKIEIQQYITRSYGSLTTFNLLFKNKEDQFSSKME